MGLPAAGGRDAVAHRAILLAEGDAADELRLADLRSDPRVDVLDRRELLLEQWRALLPRPTALELGEPVRWAYYPWRRALVAILGPAAFRRVRLDRNRNKITTAEQQAFDRLTIGVIGLSVGHVIAHTLAMEGLFGRLRLADFDSVELSNLNRIPATVMDLGVNKAVVAARRIAELDPYARVDVQPAGMTEGNPRGFSGRPRSGCRGMRFAGHEGPGQASGSRKGYSGRHAHRRSRPVRRRTV
jgi:hypothetical protein